jgi:hypothetical protein
MHTKFQSILFSGFFLFGWGAAGASVPVLHHITSKAQYAAARTAEPNDTVVLTFTNETTCHICRTLMGVPIGSDKVLPFSETLPGLAGELAGRVSFYVMDIRYEEVLAMYRAMRVSLIPYSAVYHKEPDGSLTPVGQLIGDGLGSYLRTLKIR